MDWERVYTVDDFYDQPLMGVANFEGAPHIYDREFDEKVDDYSDRYWLTEIEPDLLKLVLERWEIWLRWQSAFKAKTTTMKEHPALPPDQQRDREIRSLIGDRLRRRSAKSMLRRAEFRYRDDKYEARWT